MHSFRGLLRTWITLLLCLLPAAACETAREPVDRDENTDNTASLVERAGSFELDTPYTPPPGDPLSHHAAGFAKILCSAVFITGLDADFAAENLGYFTAPYEERARFSRFEVDSEHRAVHVHLPSGETRTARETGDQGCVTLPAGNDSLYFIPVRIESTLPAPDQTTWPMGDRLSETRRSVSVDQELVDAAVEAAFADESGMTAAFLVTWKGDIIGERYGDGTANDPDGTN